MYDLEFPRLDKVAFGKNYWQEEELIEEVLVVLLYSDKNTKKNIHREYFKKDFIA